MNRAIVKNWLLIGVIGILIQIAIGGITRLTGSGLSITRWEVVIGIIPPLSNDDWEKAFELYKETPQYKKINAGMSMAEFKFIYFWEYVHRLWARFLGLVFAIPLLYFLWRKWISIWLLKRLVVLFVLASLVAVFGWIMVASGLKDRPWVSAYKLSIHLGLALVSLMYLWKIYLDFAKGGERDSQGSMSVKNFVFRGLMILVFCQVIIGAWVGGMRAALIFPEWPLMDGKWFPEVFLDREQWRWEYFVYYERSVIAPALAQFLHRNLGYIILVIVSFAYVWNKGNWRSKVGKSSWNLFILVFIQVILGVLILIDSIGRIPLWTGVVHQLCAFLIMLQVMYYEHKLRIV